MATKLRSARTVPRSRLSVFLNADVMAVVRLMADLDVRTITDTVAICVAREARRRNMLPKSLEKLLNLNGDSPQN